MKKKKGNRDCLIIKSIPYQVNKSTLIEKIAQLVRDKKIEGIRDIRDESNREGIRVVIELRKAVEPETIRRQLYKLTNIESSFGFNTLAIVNNKPKILNLKEFISEFVNFREKTLTKKIKFDLNKALEKVHILLGISVSVENIDTIIKIIKKSETVDEAKKSLLSKKWKIKHTSKLIKLISSEKNGSSYQLSEDQVVSVLELRLQKLTAFGIDEIENEIKKLAVMISNYEKILKSKKERKKDQEPTDPNWAPPGTPGLALGTYGTTGKMFANFGTGTPVVLHGSEAVVPENSAFGDALKIATQMASSSNEDKKQTAMVNNNNNTNVVNNEATDRNTVGEKELVKIVESTTKNNNLLEQLIAVNMATERNTKLTKNSLDNMSGSLV